MSDLKQKLMYSAVKCTTIGEYLTVRGLYMMAGAEIWPWHKGFKDESNEEEYDRREYYGLEPCGFLKHVMGSGEPTLTIKELADIVLNGAEVRKELKMYAYKPGGHGELSFFVMATSEEEACKAINAKIKTCDMSDDAEGWGTDYYGLTVAYEAEVLTNCNE